MAHEEKTEQATPRRRQEAREKGQVARSVELTGAVGFLVGLYVLKTFGVTLFAHWRALAIDQFSRASTFMLTIPSLRAESYLVAKQLALMLLPLLGLIMLSGLAVNMLQAGFVLAPKALAPDFSRLNPFQGLARMFSGRAGVELLKAGGKAVLLGYLVVSFFRERWLDMVRLIQTDQTQVGPFIAESCFALALKLSGVMVVIAALDYGYQRYQFEKSLRMTKQEVKEEHKRSEGDPLLKARMRQRQREMARRRMMSSVRTATVVITNPTHLAIALRYETSDMAPVVVAKGQRLVAQRLKEIAREARVPVVENKPLAQALYKACDVNQTIPVELYQAVAEIIAFVLKQSGRVTN
ncbi:MAG: flagellar biosynthesis protein FlhB [Armatimonadota bacterium]